MRTRTICLLGLTAAALCAIALFSIDGSGLQFWARFGAAACGVAILWGAFKGERRDELAPFSEYQEIDR